MKKIFALLTGMVFLTTINCCGKDLTQVGDPTNQGKKRVKIFLRSVEIDGEIHLAMFDSNGNMEIDDLITSVSPGDIIIWKLERFSGIKKIEDIYWTGKKKIERNVFREGDPKKRFFCKGFKHRVPKGVNVQEKEEKEDLESYAIKFIPKGKDKPETIDPYIRPEPPKVGQ